MVKPGMYGWKDKENAESDLAKPDKGLLFRKMLRGVVKQVELNVLHNYNLRPMIKFVKKRYSDSNRLLRGCEIGCAWGHNSYNIMMNLPMEKLYMVDPYKTYKHHKVGHDQEFHDNMFNEMKRYMAPFGDKVIFIRKMSEKGAADIPDDSLDFVYIDGNHWYDYVKKDIELFYPKIKSGGVIGGHDFTACRGLDIGNAEVCRAVIDFIDKEGLELDGHPSDWWIIKP